MTDKQTVLRIDDLTIAYQRNDSSVEAVRDFSLSIQRGQTYGLVGESGSGKSTLAMAVMSFLNKSGFVKTDKLLVYF